MGGTSKLPETLAQALHWGSMKRRYIRGGLCDRCATQAAWAHQRGAGGWRAIHPPCAGCAEIVELFAYPTTNPLWRCLTRKRI